MHRLHLILLSCASTFLVVGAPGQDPAPTVKVFSVGELVKNHRLEDPENGLPMGVVLGNVTSFASRFVQPPLRAGEEIKSLGEKIVVMLARPAQHAWLRRFVDLNKNLDSQLMDVNCRFVRMNKRSFQKIAEPLLSRSGKRLQHAILAKGRKTTTFLATLQKRRGVDIVQAPRLCVYPAQRANMSILSQMTFVKDFHAEFDEKGKPTSIDPVVGVVQDGMLLDCTCGVIEEGMAGLSVHALWSDLKQPIKEVELKIKDCDSTLKIGVPEVDVAEIKADVRLPLGGTVMFELPESKSGHMVVFVTVSSITADKLQGPKMRIR
jgi:hypothetical protein